MFLPQYGRDTRKIIGYISGIAVLEGTQVSKGTLLAEISSPDFALLQRQLQEAGANWSFEQARFARMSGLYGKNALSAADWKLHSVTMHWQRPLSVD